MQSRRPLLWFLQIIRSFQVEENVGLVVLKHLSHKLHIHVLDVDLLEAFVHDHD